MSDPVAQINADWRVVVVSDRNAWKRPAWMIEHLVDGVWHGRAAVRAAGMLRDMVQAYAGRVDAGAAEILAALPERVDQKPRLPPSPASPPLARAAAPGSSRPTSTRGTAARMRCKPLPGLVVQLNKRWRVVVAHDGAKWILQSRHDDDWLSRAHCRVRCTLERRIQFYIGDVDPEARAILNALPGHI